MKETPLEEILAQDAEEQPPEPYAETQREQARLAEIRKEWDSRPQHECPDDERPPWDVIWYDAGEKCWWLSIDDGSVTAIVFCPFCGERLSKI